MKLTILIISICIAGTLCDSSYDCYDKEMEKCRGLPYPRKFPETIDEMKRDCMIFLTNKICRLNIDEVCEEDINKVVRGRNVVRFLNSTCQEDSPLFKVLAKHFDCFSNALSSTRVFCNDIFLKANSAVDKKYWEIQSEPEDNELFSCMVRPFASTCYPIILGEKCGDEVGNAALEIMTNTYLRMCVDEYPEKWGVLYEVYETVIREEYEKVKVLEERKRR